MNLLEQAIKLTLALYRVTDSFPKDEVLKQTLRRQGLKILELIIKQDGKDHETTPKDIKVIQSYLGVAKSLGVTKQVNLEVLQREYRKLSEELPCLYPDVDSGSGHRCRSIAARNDIKTKPAVSEINDRQKAVLEYLKQNKQVQVGDLQNIFKNISAKTIQRDLHDLVQRNILVRDGEKRWTTYYLSDNV